MSITPIKWRENVVAHYGSVSQFGDASTVEIIRSQIVKKRADLKVMLDLEFSHPDVVDPTELANMKAEDVQLADLDQELETWQAARKKPSSDAS